MDGAKILASQVASKGYFAGEAAGIRLANRTGLAFPFITSHCADLLQPVSDKLEKLPPQAAPSSVIEALRAKMAGTLEEIRSKTSSLTVQDLKRLLFRCAATLISLPKVSRLPDTRDSFSHSKQCEYEMLHYLVVLPFEVSTPAAISAGIEIWTWLIAEKPDIEIGLMGEVLSAWSDSIRQEKGMFSTSLKYVLTEIGGLPMTHVLAVTMTLSTTPLAIVRQIRRLSIEE